MSDLDTATHEAAEVTHTAAEAARDVASTSKSEAGSVVREVRTQVRDLYDQARHEVGAQAAKQQDRLASGLTAVGDGFTSMGRDADDQGLAADVAQRAGRRISAAGAWFGDRDPAGVVREVTSYARRHPGVFIAGAAITGIIVGRLTRALAGPAESPEATPAASLPAASVPTAPVTPAQPTIVDTPLYAESAARYPDRGEVSTDERPDAI